MSTTASPHTQDPRVEWSNDPFDGSTMALLSFGDPAQWAASAYTESMVDAILAEHPDAQVRIRVADGGYPTGRWRPYMSYLTLAAGEHCSPAGGSSQIVAAPFNSAHPHFDAVRSWLHRALRAGYGSALLEDSAELWLDSAASSNEWTSLVAVEDQAPVGHLTVAPDVMRSTVIPVSYCEVVDALIDLPDRDRRRQIETDLVTRAANLAAELGEDLLGNVIHPDGAETSGWNIVDSLVAQGWCLVETIWTREAA